MIFPICVFPEKPSVFQLHNIQIDTDYDLTRYNRSARYTGSRALQLDSLHSLPSFLVRPGITIGLITDKNQNLDCLGAIKKAVQFFVF